MTTPKWLPDTRMMKCKVCNKDVPVNVNYPITEVTCTSCYHLDKAQLNTPSY